MTSVDTIGEARATEDSDQVLVARAAALLHVSGESTTVTLAAVDRLNHGLGTNFELLPSWASMTVLAKGRDPVTTVAPPVGVAMRSVTIAMRVIDRVGDNTATRLQLAAELDRATKAGPSPMWLFIVACATGPAALSIIFGAHDATAVLLVAFSGALGGAARRLLGRFHIGPLGQVFAAAFLAGVIGGFAVNADLSTSLRLIAVCPAMILVPGPHILNGVLDLFALRIPLGFARLGYAAVLLLAVGSGLALALALFGTNLPVEPGGRTVPLWLDVIAAGVAAASYPVYFAIPYRLIIWPVVVGAVAHGLRTVAINDWGWNVAIGATIACFLVGIVLAPVSHRLHIPYAAVAFAAVVALVPGVYVFRMINAIGDLPFAGSNDSLLGAISDGTTAALIVLGMAVGLALPKHVYSQLTAHRERTS
ncbi:MAG: hypothetical protein JWQ43_3669 [Glaciihabitans sp.]|nr:hypothetical protein [Glaciihabitans sp.]